MGTINRKPLNKNIMSLTLKYGILLQEGESDKGKFQVATDQLVTIVIKESEDTITDVAGYEKHSIICWASGRAVKWFIETQETECMQAITDAMDAYNLKYPENPITIDQLMR